MNFNSPIFLLFLTLVVTLNYFITERYRPSLLLLSSLIFISYYSLASAIAVIAFSLFNFLLAQNISKRKSLYVLGLFVNIASILLFNFIANNETIQFLRSSPTFNFNITGVIIVLGISFYSLQNIAYLTDIYFERLIPETSILNYTLYNAFFPKIISGPVMLFKEFIPQISNNKLNPAVLMTGFNLFLLGLVKKVVIADRLSPSVHSIFDYSDNYNGITTLTGVYLFTIQLYFDFSGYTDMALGAGKMLGYDLAKNFNMPFRSKSVTEFWRRWHISLMAWLTTYIYYPIVYHLRKHKKTGIFAGIAAVFLISSIWRGINYAFLIWAICHIIYISFEYLTKQFRSSLSEKINPRFYNLLSVFLVFTAISFSNIFFRAESIAKAFQLIKNISSNFFPTNWLSEFIAPLAVGGHQMEQFNFIITLLLPLFALLFERKINHLANLKFYNVAFVIVGALLIMTFGVFNNGSRFIYMQF